MRGVTDHSGEYSPQPIGVPLNTQPIEKPQHRTDGALEVHSIFPTIQGEGPFTGHRAVFVRLAGCNLQCPKCDTEYTSRRNLIDWVELVKRVAAYKIKLVVITGGEPMRQRLGPFIQGLLDEGLQVQIETNGTIYQELPYHRISVVCSPKTGKVQPKLIPHITAFKYVGSEGDLAHDGLPAQALGHTAHPFLFRPHGLNKPVYLQPVDEHRQSASQRNLDAVVRSVMDNGYILCLQTHKIINVE